jgi:UDP-N-acetylglucosamine 2-epimerase
VKILSIVGARPEFVQVAPVSRALRSRHQEVLVHTGQHYDYLMSQTFFDELQLPAPDYNLEVGSGSQATQTGQMLVRLEEVMTKERPHAVVIRGDTNSTLAGALAASKLGLPIVHIEAGERSYERTTPEEINRLVADRLAALHFCASETAIDHLADEGIRSSVHWTGDVMLDATLANLPLALERSQILERLNLTPGAYTLVTVHRASNTDDRDRLSRIVDALNAMRTETVVFPVHPRTCAALGALSVRWAAHVKQVEPVGYLDMLMLEKHARFIATDSGGVQREAYFLGVPCVTLRDATEWTETIQAGWNTLAGADPRRILTAWSDFTPPADHPSIFGDGHAGERIAGLLDRWRP